MLARVFSLTRLLATASVASLGLVAWATPGNDRRPGVSVDRQATPPSPSGLFTPQPLSGQGPLFLDQHPVSRTDTSRPAAAPVVQWAPYEVRARACRTGRVVLSFDDGPHPDRTRELQRWLTRHDVPATFFVVGSRVHQAPRLVRELSNNPRLFTLANHTWDHPDLRRLPGPEVRESLASTRRAITGTGARASALMRPPYGALNARAVAAIRAEKLRPVLWNVDSQDWQGGNRHQIAARILAQLRPKRANVVLQHDGINNSYESVRAVPLVVEQARRRGYCFVPLKADGQPGSMLMPVRSQPSGPARASGTATR